MPSSKEVHPCQPASKTPRLRARPSSLALNSEPLYEQRSQERAESISLEKQKVLQSMPSETGNPSQGSPALPLRAAHDLQSASAALAVLAEALPSRTTVRQASAFLYIAYHCAMNRSITLAEVISDLGTEVVGKSIERTIGTFLPKTKQNPEALGWIEQETDEDDRRKKYLRLTGAGRAVCSDLIEALRLSK